MYQPTKEAVAYQSWAPRRNRGDVLVGILSAFAIIAGVGWGGELFRHPLKKIRAPMEVPTIEITMPNLEPDQEMQDVGQTSMPADLAPPTQTDIPEVVTDTSFVQPLQPSPPQDLHIQTGAVIIPAGFTGGYAKGMEVFDISKLDQVPEAIYRPQPVYPYSMRKQGVSGQVLVQFIVEINGTVSSAYAVRSTNKEFEEPAVVAVGRWRFRPGRKAGMTVRTRMEVPIVFTLED